MTNAHSLPLALPAYPVIVGRYALFDAIASGGMASVHIGRLLGSFGFARTVAIKRLHQDMALNPEFLAMFLDEARLAARVRHTNVVQTLDVVALDEELLLVMEYVSGAALSKVIAVDRRARRSTPQRVAVEIMVGVLNGLHAAHEAKSEAGEPLELVHRDVSPQNILVGTDGVARLLDFGIAKAAGASNLTRPNQIKGKLRYLSPERITGQRATRVSDIYSASVVLWEMLTGRQLFNGTTTLDVSRQVTGARVPQPSSVNHHVPRKLDELVMRGLERSPARRFQSAREMALALEAAVPPVNRSAILDWLFSNVGDEIRERERRVTEIERQIQNENGAAPQRLLARRTAPPPEASQAPPAPSPVKPRRQGWQPILLAGSLAALLIDTSGHWLHPNAHAQITRRVVAELAANIPTLPPPAPSALPTLVENVQPVETIASAPGVDAMPPPTVKATPKLRHPPRPAPKKNKATGRGH